MLESLNKLKDFLADRPEWAFLAISLAVNAMLFRLYVKMQDARFNDMLRWLPIAEKLQMLVGTAAAKARSVKKEEAPHTGEEKKNVG